MCPMRSLYVLALTVMLAFATATRAQQAGVAGRVTSGTRLDARPVRHARVGLTGGGLTSPRVTETDAQGRFRFDARAAANSRLRIQKPGFVTFDGAPAETITLVRGAAPVRRMRKPSIS